VEEEHPAYSPLFSVPLTQEGVTELQKDCLIFVTWRYRPEVSRFGKCGTAAARWNAWLDALTLPR
jgi:hypothetical protein